MSTQLPVIQPGRPREGQRPLFEKIGIVGLGLIGGSLALKARELWPGALVIGDDNKAVRGTALAAGAGVCAERRSAGPEIPSWSARISAGRCRRARQTDRFHARAWRGAAPD